MRRTGNDGSRFMKSRTHRVKKEKNFFFKDFVLCVWIWAYKCRELWKPGVRCPGTGVRGGWKLFL